MRALLVDNDRLLLDALKLTIESRQPEFEVDSAPDMSQALALAASNRYELILLKELDPEARIVVMSGDDDSQLVFKTLELGAAGFLRKHAADFDTLRQALDIVMRGGIYLPGQSPMSSDVSPSVRPQWAARDLKDCFPSVTDRQLAVLRVLLRGASDKHIARQLDIAVSTVKTHLQALYRQLGVSNRAGAVALAARLGARVD
jgi:DNA-binding NarL/FixJ family response regulator